MRIAELKKVEEGEYIATSLACPKCGESVEVKLPSQNLFLYNQGGFVQDVFPNETADLRERFQSGYCPKDWAELFADDED